jgi:hypothetical protein
VSHNAINLLGQRFGRLVVTGLAPERRYGCLVWVCKCDCGVSIQMRGTTLTSRKDGGEKSCGCAHQGATGNKRPRLAPPTQERVKALLDYDPVTGFMRWRMSRGTRRAGAIAGCLRQNGYLCIGIDGIVYQAHAVIWLWMTGAWSAVDIDHRDRNRTNNAWTNLREATRTQNQGNRRGNTGTSTGLKGVTRKQVGNWVRYQAQILFHGKNRYLGYFKTPEAAHRAYCQKAAELFGEFARSA